MDCYFVSSTAIPCARTGMDPPMGRIAGANGSVNVPSELTLSEWKALAAVVEDVLDSSLET